MMKTPIVFRTNLPPHLLLPSASDRPACTTSTDRGMAMTPFPRSGPDSGLGDGQQKPMLKPLPLRTPLTTPLQAGNVHNNGMPEIHDPSRTSRTRASWRAGRARQSLPLFPPGCPPLSPFFVPMMGTAAKAGAM